MLIRARLSSATPVRGRTVDTISQETQLRRRREPVSIAAGRRNIAARPSETRNHRGGPNPAEEITADACAQSPYDIAYQAVEGASLATRPLLFVIAGAEP